MERYLSFRDFELIEGIVTTLPKRTSKIAETLIEFRKYITDEPGDFKNDRKMNKALNEFFAEFKIKNIYFKTINRKTGLSKLDTVFMVAAEQENNITRLFFQPGFWKLFLEDNESRFGEFIVIFKNFLSHEHIHKTQNKIIKRKYPTFQGISSPPPDDTISYLSDEHELMAWAYDGAIDLIKQYSYKKCFDVIKNPDKYWDEMGDTAPLLVYRGLFIPTDPTYKKFIKYLVAYLEKIKKY